MYFMKLATLESAKSLCKICEKYKDKMYVNIIHGRQVMDGTNLLGVTSLIGNIVKIEPITHDDILVNYFYKDIKEIGGYVV